jgi:transposase InsO family protein
VAEAFAASKGRYGYRRIKAMLRTGVSEKVIRRIMAEDGLTAHVPERRGYGSYGGETTPAPGNLVTRDFTAKLCVCSIESGPCERVESLQMSGRF